MPPTAKNACCRDDSNLAEPETPKEEKPELTFRRCKVCGARHFTLKADPGSYGVKGAKL